MILSLIVATIAGAAELAKYNPKVAGDLILKVIGKK